MRFQLDKKKEVIKHSSAIQISNKVNLLQRRSWNILLANAFDDLEDKDEYEISVKNLCNVLKYNSHNDEHLKKLLKSLVSITVEWNILGKDKKQEWGVVSLLSQAIIINGILTYSYAPVLRRKLTNPSMYAKISLSIQNKFNSKHSLALYELFLDYFDIKRNYGETKIIRVDEFRKLLGLNENEYKEFKDLNKYVIKKSVSEINKISEIFITVEYKKESRKVVALKFSIKKNVNNNIKLEVLEIKRKEQKSLPLEEFEIDNQKLLQILINEFGISKNKAIDILKSMDEFYIQENLDVVRKGIKEGKIKNIPAYTVKALIEDYRSKKPKVEVEKEERKKQRIIAEEENKKMEELGNEIYKDFIQKEINPEIKLLLENLTSQESLDFKKWVSKNLLYKRYNTEEDYFKFNVYQSYLRKNNFLKNIDEKFITFAINKGYKVKKTSDIIDKWIVLKK